MGLRSARTRTSLAAATLLVVSASVLSGCSGSVAGPAPTGHARSSASSTGATPTDSAGSTVQRAIAATDCIPGDVPVGHRYELPKKLPNFTFIGRSCFDEMDGSAPGAERAAALAVQAEFCNHLAVEPELNAVLGHGEFQGERLAGLAAGETVSAHEGICVYEENLNARTYSLTDLPHSVTIAYEVLDADTGFIYDNESDLDKSVLKATPVGSAGIGARSVLYRLPDRKLEKIVASDDAGHVISVTAIGDQTLEALVPDLARKAFAVARTVQG